MGLAVSWGLVIKDRSLVCRGLKNIIIGAMVAWSSGALVGGMLSISPSKVGLESTPEGDLNVPFLYYAISVNSHEIAERGPPALATISETGVIGVFSGVAIALGFTSGISSALSGVALSASLLPPIVNSGMMFVLGFSYPTLTNKAGHSCLAIR